MPKGIYDRSKRSMRGKIGPKSMKGRVKRKSARKAKAAAPREVAILKQRDVIAAFKTQALGWHRQSLTLSCSAAVCLIIGAHSNGDRVEHSVMMEKLRVATINGTALGESQVNKYIGLARSLVNHLMLRFKVGGPVHNVIRAKTPEAAVQVVAGYLTKQKVNTLEALSVMFGKYQRTKPKGPQARAPDGVRPGKAGSPPVAPANGPTKAAGNGNGRNGGRDPRIGGLEVVRESLNTMLATLPADFVVLQAVQSGHTPGAIASAAIGMLGTTEDVAECMRALDARDKHIKSSIPASVPSVTRARRRLQMAA